MKNQILSKIEEDILIGFLFPYNPPLKFNISCTIWIPYVDQAKQHHVEEMYYSIYFPEVSRIVQLLYKKNFLIYDIDPDIIFINTNQKHLTYFPSALAKEYYDLYLKNRDHTNYISIMEEFEFELEFILNSNFILENYLTHSNIIYCKIVKIILELN